MACLDKCFLIGNLARDPELRVTPMAWIGQRIATVDAIPDADKAQ